MGVPCILGESEQGILIITEALDEGGDIEDLGNLIYCEGDQLAGLFVTFEHQPVVGEVADFEAGLEGQNFDPEICLGSLLFEFSLEQSGKDLKIILIRDAGGGKGQTTSARLH